MKIMKGCEEEVELLEQNNCKNVFSMSIDILSHFSNYQADWRKDI